MWYIVRLDSIRVTTLVKVRSGTLVSSGDLTRVKSNYIPVYTTILRQIERCPGGTRSGVTIAFQGMVGCKCHHDHCFVNYKIFVRYFTSVYNLKAIRPLLMDILHFEKSRLKTAANTVVLYLGRYQSSIATYLKGYVYAHMKYWA